MDPIQISRYLLTTLVKTDQIEQNYKKVANRKIMTYLNKYTYMLIRCIEVEIQKEIDTTFSCFWRVVGIQQLCEARILNQLQYQLA